MKKTKKEIEKENLRDFCEAAKKNDYALRFVKKLSLDNRYEEEIQEGPDFIKKFGGRVIGIEEFSVSSNSKKKSGKQQFFDYTLEEWGEKVVDNIFTLPITHNEDICRNCISELLEKMQCASYENHIESFKQNLKDHTKKANKYKENTSKKAGAKKVVIAFLITIDYQNDNLGMAQLLNQNGSNALFREMYEELKNVHGHGVKYIMLLFKNPKDLSIENKAFLFDLCNMDESIEKQNIKIIEYCIKKLFDLITISIEDVKYNGKIEMTYKIQIDPSRLPFFNDAETNNVTKERTPKQ